MRGYLPLYRASASGTAASDYTEIHNDPFGPGNRKPAGIISWFLYYAFLVATGFELLFPPQFLLVWNIFMVFMISTVTRKESLKRRCISTLLICTAWMLVEVIVLLVLEAIGTDESVINDAGSFASKMCMLLFQYCLAVTQRKNSMRKSRCVISS